MAGLTTIAAIPRTGGAGMALRCETNTRPIHYPDPFVLFRYHANISDSTLEQQRFLAAIWVGLGGTISLTPSI